MKFCCYLNCSNYAHEKLIVENYAETGSFNFEKGKRDFHADDEFYITQKSNLQALSSKSNCDAKLCRQ